MKAKDSIDLCQWSYTTELQLDMLIMNSEMTTHYHQFYSHADHEEKLNPDDIRILTLLRLAVTFFLGYDASTLDGVLNRADRHADPKSLVWSCN